MSLSLEELRSRIVALPGDLVLCPECREPLLRFHGPTLCSSDVEFLPASRRVESRREPERYTLWCRLCGSGVERHYDSAGAGVIEDSIGPRFLVRSGCWTGWRALGGE